MPEIDLGLVRGPKGDTGGIGPQGPQGPQGNPSTVNGKAADSSGAITLIPPDIGAASNTNLLINPDFRHPVNRNGQTEYTAAGYTIDGWLISAGAESSALIGDGITFTNTKSSNWFKQFMKNPSRFAGKTMTLSVLGKTTDEAVKFHALVQSSDSSDKSTNFLGNYLQNGMSVITFVVPLNVQELGLGFQTNTDGSAVKAIAAKLELGSQQTLAHQENGVWVLNDPPNYDLQYALCSLYSPTTGEWVGYQPKGILSGGVPYGKELTESWASLQARIKAGNFAGIHIGDYKTIRLTTGETVVMEVAGIDPYYRCGDQEIGHHVDFISRDCLAGTKVFNDTDTNQGTAAEPNPWRASKLFQTLNDETSGVYATLPADLKPCIIEKRALLETRYSEAGALNNSTGYIWTYMGKLWLPLEVEVFGHASWSDIGYGTWGGGCNKQYPIFIGGSLHLIKGNGNGGGRCHWWEASARRDSATDICVVSDGGNAGHTVATYGWVCAPLCFRVG